LTPKIHAARAPSPRPAEPATAVPDLDAAVVYLDLETTGASAGVDRITEVGFVEHRGGREVARDARLVNPGRSIPMNIQILTGISDAMVAGAPPFAALAAELHARLAGKLLVAHNARFDHGFLREEFARVGIDLQVPVLCTVRLSRRLYSHERRHNLDSVIARHGLRVDGARHRALGDAAVLADFVAAARADLGDTVVLDAARALTAVPPPATRVDHLGLDALPDTPGVYAFVGARGEWLYVGKSVNLRSRVFAHLSPAAKLVKDRRLAEQVADVRWFETAGELGALLLEAKLVKQHAPIHNRALREVDDLVSWHWDPAGGRPPVLVTAGDLDFAAVEHLYGVFPLRTRALKALRGLADAHGLCLKRTGLEPAGRAGTACFARQLHRCRGACVGAEPPVAHDLRLAQALHGLKLAAWPFRGRVGLVERDPLRGRTQVHVVDRWCWLGSVDSKDALADFSPRDDARPSFDLDSWQLLSRWLKHHRHEIEVIDLPAARVD
jgi:DNA polymerase-3 subunit epsilon